MARLVLPSSTMTRETDIVAESLGASSGVGYRLRQPVE
jgi:hypothetical protein